MAQEKKYKTYTAADIEKYHQGLLSAAEMNHLEKAALDDPFLADALEGYGSTHANVTADLSELKKRLGEKVGGGVVGVSRRSYSLNWWKIAAAIVIICGIGYFTFRISNGSRRDSSIADLQKKRQDKPVPQAVTDSTRISKEQRPDSATGEKPVLVTATRKTKPRTTDAVSVDRNGEAAVANKIAEAGTLTKPTKDSETIKSNRNSVGYSPLLSKPRKAQSDVARTETFATMSDQRAGLKEQQAMNYFKGRVVDDNNNPLPFANVTSTAHNVGTYADAEGNFTLIATDSVLYVQIRSLGFENKLVALKSNAGDNKITMDETKSVADRIISHQKPDTSRARNGNMKLEEPEPVDGWTNYNTYLVNNVNVPTELQAGQENAHVSVSFQVDKNGDPVNIKVNKSLCQRCDEEAIRLIKQGPKWKKKTKKLNRVNLAVPFDTNQ